MISKNKFRYNNISLASGGLNNIQVDRQLYFGDINKESIINNISLLLQDIPNLVSKNYEYEKIQINQHCKLILDIEEMEEIGYDYTLWFYSRDKHSDVLVCNKNFNHIDPDEITKYFSNSIFGIDIQNSYSCINNCNRIAVCNNFCRKCLSALGKNSFVIYF